MKEVVTRHKMPCVIIAPVSELGIGVYIGTQMCPVLRPHATVWPLKGVSVD